MSAFGINLLREGLDLPEVSLVAILDVDKEGFSRPQNGADPIRIGRAALGNSAKCRVIMYADAIPVRCNGRSTRPTPPVGL